MTIKGIINSQLIGSVVNCPAPLRKVGRTVKDNVVIFIYLILFRGRESFMMTLSLTWNSQFIFSLQRSQAVKNIVGSAPIGYNNNNNKNIVR